MRPKVGTPDKIVFFGPPSQTLLFGAYSFEGGDSFLLIKIERHYSECGDNRISIFLIPMPVSTVWTGSPKGALMQTKVCVRQEFRFPAPRQGAFLPLDPDQPCAGWMPETFRGFITTKGGGPLPSTPTPPCAGWMRGRAFAPCTTTGGRCPPATPAPAPELSA